MKEKLESLSWFGRLEDLTEELEDMGLEVLEANCEYVVVGYEEDGDDIQLILHLGGTARTIIITNVEEA
ncbi:MAG: hypothetical protein HFG00_02890 [Oscillibacter sp.]|nr:hypothetical protein [Oscillibacter sp.]